MWLQVRDLDVVAGELDEAGVGVLEPPAYKPWGLREMRIQDPDGVRLVIVEVPEDHPACLRRRRPRHKGSVSCCFSIVPEERVAAENYPGRRSGVKS